MYMLVSQKAMRQVLQCWSALVLHPWLTWENTLVFIFPSYPINLMDKPKFAISHN